VSHGLTILVVFQQAHGTHIVGGVGRPHPEVAMMETPTLFPWSLSRRPPPRVHRFAKKKTAEPRYCSIRKPACVQGQRRNAKVKGIRRIWYGTIWFVLSYHIRSCVVEESDHGSSGIPQRIGIDDPCDAIQARNPPILASVASAHHSHLDPFLLRTTFKRSKSGSFSYVPSEERQARKGS
jgi:hypothetical protein